MMSLSQKVRSKPSHRPFEISPLKRKQLAYFLVERVPRAFDQILKWLSTCHLLLLILSLLCLLTPLLTSRPAIWQQAVVGMLLIPVGHLVLKMEEQESSKKASEYLHLFLILLSLITTLRYLYYRVHYTLNFDNWISVVFSLLLLAAELYQFGVLVLSYFITLKLKDREPVDFSLYPQEQWFKVDIYIPTYNEDVEIVRKTTLAALDIDYPSDKKRVYVLADGWKEEDKAHRKEEYKAHQKELRQMCEELGATMLTRDNNENAKAGNINAALKCTEGHLVLILDCDHIPAKHFLMDTVGFFFNPKVAFVQTPHWFYNPDPFERNLVTEGQIPVSNEIFYRVVQKGLDFWNAALFCGSAAVLRKEYLLQVDGLATETVTEDIHTGLRLHSLGYESVYYDKIMIAGLAPEKFSVYVGQQIRWERGKAQILRRENPLFNPKLHLTLPQRLCYFSVTAHAFYGFPRLMYALIPPLFLLFGISSARGLGVETLFYALPHIILSMQTNHIPYKYVRFSFWNEIFEFVMSFQSGLVTLLALIDPKLGKFYVTDKGLSVTKRSFDFDSVGYLVIVATIEGASLFTVPFWLILSPKDTLAVLAVALLCLFNFFLLLAACLVAFEQPQFRRTHRLRRKLTAVIHYAGMSWKGQTIDVSENGTQVLIDEWPNIPDEVKVELVGDYGARVLLNGQVIRAIATSKLQARIFIDFVNITRLQLDDLTLVLFSDVKEWYSQTRKEVDNPVESLKFIVTSFKRVFREFRPAVGVKVRKQVDAFAQLYWEGWEGQSYTANLTEIGTQDARVELVGNGIFNLETMQNTQPLIGLLLSQKGDTPQPTTLLGRVETIEDLTTSPVMRIAIELSFPEPLKRQQQVKIQRLLKTLQ